MKIPNHMIESEFLEVLEKAVSDVVRNFSVAYFEKDDLKQEARLFALECLSKYSKTKGTLYTFIRAHIHNRLINLSRNISFRPTAPCFSCEFHDIDTSPSEQTGCFTYKERGECIRWVKWMRVNISKRNLSSPSPNETFPDNDDVDVVLDDVYKNELKTLISKNIPLNMRADYLKMMDGISLPIKRRTKLLAYLKGLLVDMSPNNREDL
jgi:hypothetical protein